MPDPEIEECATLEEMYELLLKEFEDFKDEGRDEYFDDLLKKIRKDLDDMKE